MPIGIIIALELACLAVYVTAVSLAGVFTKKGFKKHNVNAQVKVNRQLDKELTNSKGKVKNINRLNKLRRNRAHARLNSLKWNTKTIDEAYSLNKIEALNKKNVNKKLRKKRILEAKANYKQSQLEANNYSAKKQNKKQAKLDNLKAKYKKIAVNEIDTENTNYSYTRERDFGNKIELDKRTRIDCLTEHSAKEFEEYVKSSYNLKNNDYPYLAEVIFNKESGLNNTRVSSPDKACLDKGLELLKKEALEYAVMQGSINSVYPLTIKTVDLKNPKKIATETVYFNNGIKGKEMEK